MPQDDLLDELFESGMDPFGDGYANAPMGSEYANAPMGSEYANAPMGSEYANAPMGSEYANAPTSDYGHTPSHVPGGGAYGHTPSHVPGGGAYGHTPSHVPGGGGYGHTPSAVPGGSAYGHTPSAVPGGGAYGHTPSGVGGGSPGPAPQARRSPSAPGGGHGGGATLEMDKKYKDEARHRDVSGHFMKHVTDDQVRWRKYGVTIGKPMFRRGAVFDSENLKKHFASKHADTFGYGSAMSGSTFGDSARTGIAFDWPTEWAQKGVIWICMAHPMTGRVQFYSHVGKRRPDNQSGYHFGHSSLSAGADVIGAGEWIVEQGMLKSVSANSGHYQPTIASLHQAMQHMIGAINESTTVFLYDKVDDRWDYRGAFDFLDSPTGGGRYWAHPRAQG